MNRLEKLSTVIDRVQMLPELDFRSLDQAMNEVEKIAGNCDFQMGNLSRIRNISFSPMNMGASIPERKNCFLSGKKQLIQLLHEIQDEFRIFGYFGSTGEETKVEKIADLLYFPSPFSEMNREFEEKVNSLGYLGLLKKEIRDYQRDLLKTCAMSVFLIPGITEQNLTDGRIPFCYPKKDLNVLFYHIGYAAGNAGNDRVMILLGDRCGSSSEDFPGVKNVFKFSETEKWLKTLRKINPGVLN